MSLPQSFQKHGTFFYNIPHAIERFGSIEGLVERIERCDMTHAWLRGHGRRSLYGDKEQNKEVIAALMEKGVAVAIWGWCQGEDIEQEADLALFAIDTYALPGYVANIEHGTNGSDWSIDKMEKFIGAVRNGMPDDGAIGISSFGLIGWHRPELMKAVDEIVDMFAPQAYWFWYPDQKMVDQFGRYELGAPSEYVRLCIDNWRKYVTKPLVITGQAYWGEGGFAQGESEDKLADFTQRFEQWGDIAGLNWWNAAGPDAMSDKMIEIIAGARISHNFQTIPEALIPASNADDIEDPQI